MKDGILLNKIALKLDENYLFGEDLVCSKVVLSFSKLLNNHITKYMIIYTVYYILIMPHEVHAYQVGTLEES